MDSQELQQIPNPIHEFIVEPFSGQLEKYKRGPAIDQIAKQALEKAFGKKLTEITEDD